jgi:hypothetical protein
MTAYLFLEICFLKVEAFSDLDLFKELSYILLELRKFACLATVLLAEF